MTMPGGEIPVRMAAPMYPPEMTRPMEEELTRLGVQALHTPEEVDKVVGSGEGTVLVVVNSVCGCAAGQARPGIALALTNEKKPTHAGTVFAGVDREATNKARAYFTGFQLRTVRCTAAAPSCLPQLRVL